MEILITLRSVGQVENAVSSLNYSHEINGTTVVQEARKLWPSFEPFFFKVFFWSCLPPIVPWECEHPRSSRRRGSRSKNWTKCDWKTRFCSGQKGFWPRPASDLGPPNSVTIHAERINRYIPWAGSVVRLSLDPKGKLTGSDSTKMDVLLEKLDAKSMPMSTPWCRDRANICVCVLSGWHKFAFLRRICAWACACLHFQPICCPHK